MIRDIIWWSYERASWQWDVLCILIMAFIFLTPKTWFDKREKLATQSSPRAVKQMVISPDEGRLVAARVETDR